MEKTDCEQCPNCGRWAIDRRVMNRLKPTVCPQCGAQVAVRPFADFGYVAYFFLFFVSAKLYFLLMAQFVVPYVLYVGDDVWDGIAQVPNAVSLFVLGATVWMFVVYPLLFFPVRKLVKRAALIEFGDRQYIVELLVSVLVAALLLGAGFVFQSWVFSMSGVYSNGS